MKTFLVQAILMCSIISAVYGQSEDFENATDGATLFTVGQLDFTTTGDLFIEIIHSFGCNQSNGFVSSGTFDGGSSGSFGSIKVINPGGRFTVSTSLAWCVFISADDGGTGTEGDIKFTGILASGDTIEETMHVDNTQDMFDDLAFSSEIWEDQELTELEASIVSSFNYMALDNIVLENTLITGVASIEEDKIRMYPNPVVGELEIIGIDDFDVTIIDAFGRIVDEQSLFNQKIDFSGLQTGVYYISIITSDQQITKRIVKH